MTSILRTLGEAIDARVNEIHRKLESEEAGRVIASMQGELSGLKVLLKTIGEHWQLIKVYEADHFEMERFSELDGEELAELWSDTVLLRQSEDWKQIGETLSTHVDTWKDNLFFYAEKSRDLDIAQGKYKGVRLPESIFNRIESEVEKRKKAMPLFTQDDDEEYDEQPVIEEVEDEADVIIDEEEFDDSEEFEEQEEELSLEV